jgi:multisubunit Na+/H+ antiporter MnhE subunit
MNPSMQRFVHHVLVAVALFGFWVVLSARLQAFYLVIGAVTAVAISAVSGGLLYTEGLAKSSAGKRRWLGLFPWPKLARFAFTLLVDIIRSNLSVARLVVGPLSRVRPGVVTIEPRLRCELSSVVLGNSIILTPGATVLDITDDGRYVVHVLKEEFAESLPEDIRRARAFEPERGSP